MAIEENFRREFSPITVASQEVVADVTKNAAKLKIAHFCLIRAFPRGSELSSKMCVAHFARVIACISIATRTSSGDTLQATRSAVRGFASEMK